MLKTQFNSFFNPVSLFLNMRKIYSVLFISLLAFAANAQETPSFKLHSHNDYLRNVPFWKAFSVNAASIEVDVILQDGQLMVAHEVETIQPERTFTSLYLEPIRHAKSLKLIDDFNFLLLVDFKTEAYATMQILLEDLKPFESLLYSDKNPTGLRLVISGNRPKPADYINYPEHVFFDYQSTTLDSSLPWDKIAMVSLSFRQFSNWNGKGHIAEEEKQKLEDFIQNVHSFDRPVRFWAAPDSKSAWKAFFDMGVDYINTDKPYEANSYLLELTKNSSSRAK